MRLPKLNMENNQQQMQVQFGGYNHNPRIAEGEWYEETNMSAAEYPLLSTRPLRHVVRTVSQPAGCITKDAMAVVSGSTVIYNGYTVEMGLSTAADMCPKQLVSMGAYLLIWPDKKYLNTQDLSDKGSMENSFTASGEVTIQLSNAEGTAYSGYTASPSEPENPANGALWMDTSNPAVPVLKEWSAASTMWVQIPTTYIKIAATGIGAGFEQYDGVNIDGLAGSAEEFNGSRVIFAKDDNWIVVVGIMTTEQITQTGGLTVSRAVPDMDFVTECDNRVWGCKYGLVNGEPVNEIYASKLGDFKNWSCYMGLATDSYAAGRGSDGVFTGAITHQGHPLFFRENCIERVYPSASGAHQIVTVEGRGVQEGCWRSLAIVGETLYYKSRKGVCAYTGALPTMVSGPLGDEKYSDARAGTVGALYYISMKDSSGGWHMFTYDSSKSLWHREDDTPAMMFSRMDGDLYYLDERNGKLVCCTGGSGTGLRYQWQYMKPNESDWTDVTINGTSATYTVTVKERHDGYRYRCVVTDPEGFQAISHTATLTIGDAVEAAEATPEDVTVTVGPAITRQPVDYTGPLDSSATFRVEAVGGELNWQVTSGALGLDLVENEYISRFVVRCETTGSIELEMSYDEGDMWHEKGTYNGNGLGSFVLPVPPRRCDHLRIRLTGTAPCRIYSIAKYINVGSDVMW